MRFFENKLSIAVVLFCLPLLFFPKINLLSIYSEESAGLRVDDIILFFIGLLLIGTHILSHQKIYPFEGWLLLFTAFSFLSFLINQMLVILNLLPMSAKIFYAMRIMEYFIFFYVGAISYRLINGKVLIKAFFLWNLMIIIFQKLKLIGAVSVVGYHEEASHRVYGIASFPSEMGLLLNLIFCYIIWDSSAKSYLIHLFPRYIHHIMSHLYLYFMFGLFGIFIVFTGNRISILALFICFFCRLIQISKLRSLNSLILFSTIISILLAGGSYFIYQTEGLYERSSLLFSTKNFELFKFAWKSVDTSEVILGEHCMASDLATEHYDMSLLIRVHKWIYMLKSYLMHPECYLQGLGPGFAGAAVDGGVVRLLTENGLIGIFLIWKFLSCLYKLNSQTQWMMISFVINLLFFDAYLAYKAMSFLFFTAGYIFESQQFLKLSEKKERFQFSSNQRLQVLPLT